MPLLCGQTVPLRRHDPIQGRLINEIGRGEMLVKLAEDGLHTSISRFGKLRDLVNSPPSSKMVLIQFCPALFVPCGIVPDIQAAALPPDGWIKGMLGVQDCEAK